MTDPLRGSVLRLIPRRITRHWRLLAALVLFGAAAGLFAITTNALGAGDRFERLVERVDRFVSGPVPERSTLPTIDYTPPPIAIATPSPEPTRTPQATRPSGSGEPSASISPTAS